MMSQLSLIRLAQTLPFKHCCYTIRATTRSLASKAATINTTTSTPSQDQTIPSADNKASPEQLALMEKKLVAQLPRFFSQPHNFQLYSKDVVLLDNIRNLRVQGISQYSLQVSLVKMYHFIRYSVSNLELLNLVRNPEESCLKIRWRVISKPGLIRFVLTFWKSQKTEIWTDGISTIYVNKDGLIYCHVCDKIDLQTEAISNKAKKTSPLINLTR